MDILANPTVWVLFSFLIFLGLVKKFAWPAVISGLDSKIAQIRKDIETAEALKRQAQALLTEYQDKQMQSAAQAKQMLSDAQNQAAALRRTEEEKLNDTIARKEAQLADRLARMKEQAIADIRAEVATLATQATEELIARHMDAAKSRALTQSSIDKLN